MNQERETTISLLSLAAMAIDLLVVLMITRWLSGFVLSGVFDIPSRYLNWVELASFPVALILHLALVEIVAGGYSFGRLCAGLTVQGAGQDGRLPHAGRVRRLLTILLGGGLRSFNPIQLAPYNKRAEGYLQSDWVGSVRQDQVPANPQKPADPFKGKPGQPHIEVIAGPHAGYSVQLSAIMKKGNEGIFVIGRDPRSAHLALETDASVSRIHCRITYKNGAWLLIDGASPSQPSTHGTFVNGTRISHAKPAQLTNDTVIRVGSSQLRLKV